MKIYQYLKKQKNSGSTLLKVYTRVSNKNETPYEFSTKISVNPNEWNSRKQTIESVSPDNMLKQAELVKIKTLLEFEIPAKLRSSGLSDVSVEDIKREHKKMLGKTDSKPEERSVTTLIDLIDEYIEEMRSGGVKIRSGENKGKPISGSTLRSRTSMLRKVSEIIASSSINPDVSLFTSPESHSKDEHKAVDKHWSSLMECLTMQLKRSDCKQNTVRSYLVAFVIALKWFEKKHYINLNSSRLTDHIESEERAPVEVINLDQHSQIVKNYDKYINELESEGERISFDYSVVASLITFRVSDLINLNAKNFMQVNGVWSFKTKIQKTGKIVYIPLPEVVVRIFQKYQKKEGVLLPKRNYDYLLRNLKSAYKKLPIDSASSVGFHLFRKTAITSMIVNEVPEVVIKGFSSHSLTSKSFERYVDYAQPFINNKADLYFKKIGG